jgi:heme-degrading monooxygenase HmoA
MITEHAILDVRPGREREFESAFAKAKPIIAGMPGFRSLTLKR